MLFSWYLYFLFLWFATNYCCCRVVRVCVCFFFILSSFFVHFICDLLRQWCWCLYTVHNVCVARTELLHVYHNIINILPTLRLIALTEATHWKIHINMCTFLTLHIAFETCLGFVCWFTTNCMCFFFCSPLLSRSVQLAFVIFTVAKTYTTDFYLLPCMHYESSSKWNVQIETR